MNKKIIFLITIIGILLSFKNVQANANKFYEAEYIKGIWMTKEKNNIRYYQTARFFRRTDNNDFVYCIEPFAMFNENGTYQETINPSNLSQSQKDRIILIAHFGYNYKNHTEIKWYAITQMMIWQEADTSGRSYFTDKLDGKEINPFQNEMNEINNLINEYNTIPTIANQKYELVEDNNYIINDQNQILNKYTVINNNKVKIENNNLIISNLEENNYVIKLSRKDINYNKPIIFYEGNNTQNMMETGDIEKNIKLEIFSRKNNINIKKVDQDTKEIKPQGEASFKDTTFALLDEENNSLGQYKIDENNEINIKNLKYGKYYLKEIKSGEGYKLNSKLYEIILDKDNRNINLEISNEIIKKEINIIKFFGDKNNYHKEKDIEFEILNNNNEIKSKIKTNDEGVASIILPYGKYKIRQLNTTEGYQKIDDIIIDIKDEEKKTINLYDNKIKVPNTSHIINNNKDFIIILITLLLIGTNAFIKIKEHQ